MQTKFKDKWQRHTIAVPSYTRKFERHTLGKDGTIVRAQVEELVHVHDVYRLKIEGKKKADNRLWWRGVYIRNI